jgi:hypothetical protein
MAYVVTRPKGRFEIRESLHTAAGPRARSLAGFDVLSDGVLAKAAQRAQRPFDVGAVLASGRRAGARVTAGAGGKADDAPRRFVEASRRMALALRRPPPAARSTDPATALIDLLGFADAVARGQPARPFAPLEFPVLSRLVEGRRASVGARRVSVSPRRASASSD